ncbi:MAG: glycosyltransferase [Elusimicrobia bacterium]|nr:glycosyltransferase [Candidatus Liberimonas magnetica]
METNIQKPLFSIGVTTFDRVDMLKETLNSILNQTFTDFEVIVSNNNPDKTISADNLGIFDARIRYINQKKDLGQLGNQNFLLSQAKGRYFTWTADDDLYSAQFLEAVNLSLINYNFPSCVYTSYDLIYDNILKPKQPVRIEPQEFKGYEFLNLYCKGKLKAIGVMGVFDTNYLKSIGGLEDLSKDKDGRGLYCEYMILLKSSELEKIVHINSPLVYYRVHKDAWGISNTNVDQYMIAGERLISSSIDILKRDKKSFLSNIYFFLKLTIYNYISVLGRARGLLFKDIIQYLYSIKKRLFVLKEAGLYNTAILVLLAVSLHITASLIWNRVKNIIK